MAAFKTRANVFLPTSLKVGTSGTKVSSMYFGTVAACAPALGASTQGTGSAYIAGLSASGMVICNLQKCGSGLGLLSVCPISANTASLTFFSLGATAASTVEIGYIVLNG